MPPDVQKKTIYIFLTITPPNDSKIFEPDAFPKPVEAPSEIIQFDTLISPKDVSPDAPCIAEVEARCEIEPKLDSPTELPLRLERQPREGVLFLVEEDRDRARARALMESAIEEVLSLPSVEREPLLTEFQGTVNAALENLCPVPPLPDPDSTGQSYSIYQKRTNALEHLEETWGQWLKKFNPKLGRDYLHQDELNERDPNLLTAVRNQINRLHSQGLTKERPGDFIPPRHLRTDVELAETPEDLIKHHASLRRSQRKRSAKLTLP